MSSLNPKSMTVEEIIAKELMTSLRVKIDTCSYGYHGERNIEVKILFNDVVISSDSVSF